MPGLAWRWLYADRDFTGGRVVDDLVSQVDLFATLTGNASLPVPRKEIFAELTYHAAYDPCRAIRTDRYKLIRYWEDGPRWINVNVDDSLTKKKLFDAGLPSGTRPRLVMFDLIADPQEFVNVAELPEYATIRRD